MGYNYECYEWRGLIVVLYKPCEPFLKGCGRNTANGENLSQKIWQYRAKLNFL